MKLLYRIYNIFIVETLELEQENQELKKQLENQQKRVYGVFRK